MCCRWLRLIGRRELGVGYIGGEIRFCRGVGCRVNVCVYCGIDVGCCAVSAAGEGAISYFHVLEDARML
jgi:hypothetical protein